MSEIGKSSAGFLVCDADSPRRRGAPYFAAQCILRHSPLPSASVGGSHSAPLSSAAASVALLQLLRRPPLAPPLRPRVLLLGHRPCLQVWVLPEKCLHSLLLPSNGFGAVVRGSKARSAASSMPWAIWVSYALPEHIAALPQVAIIILLQLRDGRP